MKPKPMKKKRSANAGIRSISKRKNAGPASTKRLFPRILGSTDVEIAIKLPQKVSISQLAFGHEHVRNVACTENRKVGAGFWEIVQINTSNFEMELRYGTKTNEKKKKRFVRTGPEKSSIFTWQAKIKPAPATQVTETEPKPVNKIANTSHLQKIRGAKPGARPRQKYSRNKYSGV